MDKDQEEYLKSQFAKFREVDEKQLSNIIENLRKDKPNELRLILYKLQKDEEILVRDKILSPELIKTLRFYILKSKTTTESLKIIKEDIQKQFSHLNADELEKKITEAVKLYNDNLLKKKEQKTKKKLRQKTQTKKTDEELITEFRKNLEKQLSHKSPEEREKRLKEEIEKYKNIIGKRNKTIDQLVEDEKVDIAKKLNEFIDKKKLDEHYNDLVNEYFSSLYSAKIKLQENIIIEDIKSNQLNSETNEEKKDFVTLEIQKFNNDIKQIYDQNINEYVLSIKRNSERYEKLFDSYVLYLMNLITEIVKMKYPKETSDGMQEAIVDLGNKYKYLLNNIFEEYDGVISERVKLFNNQYEKTVKQYQVSLEDGKIFNQRMEEKRKELEEIKYGDTPEGLNFLRKALVDMAIKSKKDFLGVADEQDRRNIEANKDKMRSFEPGKEPIVNAISPIKPSEIENKDNNQIEEVENDLPEETTDGQNTKPVPFEHNHPAFISHESIARSNFRDMDYYYKVRKFYIDHPYHLKPYINLLYWDSTIKAQPEVTEEEIKKIDEQDARSAEKRALLKQKKADERKRVKDEALELEKIDNELKQLQIYIDDGKLTIEEANERAEPLITRRNIISPPEKTPEQLLSEYAIEMREKYSKIENVQFERKNIISMELAEYGKLAKREITRDRKLREEKKEKLDEMKNSGRYILEHNKDTSKIKYNMSKINEELDQYFKYREKELNDYFIPHGVDPKEHDDMSIRSAKTVFADYCKQKNTDAWKSMDADMKIEYMRAKYAPFYDAFPIVVKFMVQQDKFEVEAFKRFLEKCRTNVAEKGANPYSTQIPKKGTRRLTLSEEKWLENQAYYARYLVEEYRKNPHHHKNERDEKGKLKPKTSGRLSEKEGKWIFTTQLEALRKEMMDFRQNFEKVAEDLKAKHDENDMKLIMQYIDEMKSGACDLTPEEQENIAFAVEQVLTRKEELKKKIKDIEVQSAQELVDIESENVDIKDEQDGDNQINKPNNKKQITKKEIKKTKEEIEFEERQAAELLLQQERKSNKVKLLKLHRKAKQGQKLTSEERKEFVNLKKYFSSYEEKPLEKQEIPKDNRDKLYQTIGCSCLYYRCPKCSSPLTKEEKNKYENLVKNIYKKAPEHRNIYEAFICKNPSNDLTLQEYAGGYLDPVSIRQFLSKGEFTINGDKLDYINSNKKYGGFWTDTKKVNKLQEVIQRIPVSQSNNSKIN